MIKLHKSSRIRFLNILKALGKAGKVQELDFISKKLTIQDISCVVRENQSMGDIILTKSQLEEQVKAFENQAQSVLSQIVGLRDQIELFGMQTLHGDEKSNSRSYDLLDQIAKDAIESLKPLSKWIGLLSLERRLVICKAAMGIAPI